MAATLEVLEYRYDTMHSAIHELVELQKKQSVVNNNLTKSIELMQQSHNEFLARYEREEARYQTEDRVQIKSMWDSRSQVSGGWSTVKDRKSVV